MTSLYLHAPSRGRRHPRWRRWLLALIGLAALFLAPALAHSQGVPADSPRLLRTAHVVAGGERAMPRPVRVP